MVVTSELVKLGVLALLKEARKKMTLLAKAYRALVFSTQETENKSA